MGLGVDTWIAVTGLAQVAVLSIAGVHALCSSSPRPTRKMP
jgi:hypothetical protein